MWLPISGCATAGGGDDGGDDTPDAARPVDAFVPPVVDAMSPMPDAMPPEPDATPCTDMDVQLLGNPSFDLGPGGGWVEVAANAVVRDTGSLPGTVGTHSGNYAAWLGGVNGATRTIYQDLTLPANATNVRLSLYRWIATEETGGGIYDRVTLTLRDTSNGVLETIAEWNNQTTVQPWTVFDYTVLGAFAGQTVRLHLSSTQDGTLNTNFFIDSVALRATVCL